MQTRPGPAPTRCIQPTPEQSAFVDKLFEAKFGNPPGNFAYDREQWTNIFMSVYKAGELRRTGQSQSRASSVTSDTPQTAPPAEPPVVVGEQPVPGGSGQMKKFMQLEMAMVDAIGRVLAGLASHIDEFTPGWTDEAQAFVDAFPGVNTDKVVSCLTRVSIDADGQHEHWKSADGREYIVPCPDKHSRQTVEVESD
jgi:hypothetical protein